MLLQLVSGKRPGGAAFVAWRGGFTMTRAVVLPWAAMGNCHGTYHGHDHGTCRVNAMADGDPRDWPWQLMACHGCL